MSPGRGGRTIMHPMRWSEAEWRRVRFEARRHGLCPATYLRRASLGEIASPPPLPRAPRAQRTRFQAARSGSLTIRVHEEELGRIRRAAEDLGMQVATFVREAAVDQISSRADGAGAGVSGASSCRLARQGPVADARARPGPMS